MALRRVVQKLSTQTFSTVCNRRGLSGQLLEKFRKVYGSHEGIPVDTILQVILLVKILHDRLFLVNFFKVGYKESWFMSRH